MISNMSFTPKVTAVVAIHNSESSIKETLCSIAAQTMRRLEVICVLNGCDDKSEDIVRSFADADSRFLPVVLERGSAALARNTGLEASCGDYVAFLDADDLFEPTFLEEMAVALDSTDGDIAVCEADCFTDDSSLQRRAHVNFPDGLTTGVVDLASCRGSLLYSTGTMAWNKMFRRRFIMENDLRFQDLANTNDAFFVLASLLACKSAVLVKGSLVHYRIAEHSTQGRRAGNPLCSIEAVKAVQRFHEEHLPDLDRKTLLYLDARCVEFVTGALAMAASSGIQLEEAYDEFRGFAEVWGAHPGFERINRRTALKYWAFRRCSLPQIRWVYKVRGAQRVATKVGKFRLAVRMTISCLAPTPKTP